MGVSVPSLHRKSRATNSLADIDMVLLVHASMKTQLYIHVYNVAMVMAGLYTFCICIPA